MGEDGERDSEQEVVKSHDHRRPERTQHGDVDEWSINIDIQV